MKNKKNIPPSLLGQETPRRQFQTKFFFKEGPSENVWQSTRSKMIFTWSKKVTEMFWKHVLFKTFGWHGYSLIYNFSSVDTGSGELFVCVWKSYFLVHLSHIDFLAWFFFYNSDRIVSLFSPTVIKYLHENKHSKY